jgi:sugar O-acyltransferase (sialic acid O-acetyltransferase NeuD family)
MKEIVILGGPGDGVVVAATVSECEMLGTMRLAGFLNDALQKGDHVDGVPVLGRLEDWNCLPGDYVFIAALHKIKQMENRAKRIGALGIPADRWASVIDPAARVSRGVEIGHGTFVGPNVVLQPGARLGNHVSIRGGANLGHDVLVGDYCYIGPNATLCGRSWMESGAHLGPNSCIADGVSMGEFSVVGIASAVTKRVPPRHLYFGVPARKISVLGDLDGL